MTARALLGLVLLDTAFLVSGYSLLCGLGFVRSRRSSLRYAGLALFAGWALTGAAIASAAGLGFDPSAWVLLLITLGTIAAAAFVSRLFPALTFTATPLEPGPLRRLAALGGAGLIGLGLTSALVTAVRAGADPSWDVWAFWLAKAKAIYYFHGLDTGVGGFTSFANQDYPPLQPAVAAISFHLMGGVHPALLPLQQCVLGAAFVAAAVVLLLPYVPRWILFPSLAMLVLSPVFHERLATVLPDQSVAYLLAAATIGCVLWIQERRPAWIALSIVFLAAAALTKNEGAFLGGLLATTMLIASVAVHRRSGVVAAALLLGPAAIVSWKLWLRRHGLKTSDGNYSWHNLLDRDFLAERSDRLGYAAGHMAHFVFGGGSWLLVLPLALGAIALAARSVPAPAAALLAWLVIGFAGLLTVYWIGTPEVHWYVQTSARRVVGTLPLVAGTVLPLLLGLALAHERQADRGHESPPG